MNPPSHPQTTSGLGEHRTLLPVLPLQRWLVLSHLTVLLLPLVTLLATGALARDLEQQTREDLDHQASLLALHIATEVRHLREDKGVTDARHPPGIADVAEPITQLLGDAKQLTLAGFRVVDDRGIVVASSGGVVGDDISEDEEVRTALAGSTGLALRARPTQGSRSQSLSSPSRQSNVRVFVARPVRLQNRAQSELLGAVVLSRTPREEWQTLWQMAPQLWFGAVAAVVTTTGMAFVSGYFLSRSLSRLAQVGGRLAAGDPDNTLDHVGRSQVLEVRALAASLRTMSERLRARLTYISDFAANVSHEFKTPVSTLLGTVEILKDDLHAPELTPDQKARFLDNATSDLQRLSRLVSGLLRLARAEEGSERRRLDLTALVQETAARLNVPVSGAAGAVLGNAEELQSVLTNLVENGQTHGRGSVWIELVPSGFDVVDNGAGISDANLPRIFERFFTTARDAGGTGLGLAVVRAIVVAHGGTITVASRAAPAHAEADVTETRFRVRLPPA